MKFFDKIRWHKPDKKQGGGYKKTNDGKIELEKEEKVVNDQQIEEEKNYEIEEHTRIFVGFDLCNNITHYDETFISGVSFELNQNLTQIQTINNIGINNQFNYAVQRNRDTSNVTLEFNIPPDSNTLKLIPGDSSTEIEITNASNTYTASNQNISNIKVKAQEENTIYEVRVYGPPGSGPYKFYDAGGNSEKFQNIFYNPGDGNTTPNPKLRVKDGDTIIFNVESSNHPFKLQEGTNTLINGVTSGSHSIVFESNKSYSYVCTLHASMTNSIEVVAKDYVEIFSIDVIDEKLNAYIPHFFLDSSGTNEITQNIKDASFFKKGKSYIFQKFRPENDIPFSSYDNQFSNIFITDNSSNSFNDEGDHSIISEYMFPNKEIIKTKGLNLPNRNNEVAIGSLIPDRIKFHIPEDYNGNHLQLVYYEDANANNETQFDSLPKYRETINLFYLERDDIVTIMPIIEKPKPIKLDWYSEIKPEADGNEIENNDKLRWKYKLEGENEWKTWNGLGANRNKFNDEDFDAIKNESGKRIKKLQLVALDDNGDETVQKQDFFIKKDLEGKKEDINETIRHVENNIKIKRLDIQGRLREKKLVTGGTKDDIDKEKIEYMRAMVEQENWSEQDKNIHIKSKDIFERIDEVDFTSLKNKDIYLRKPMNDDHFDVPLVSGDYKNIMSLTDVENKEKNLFFPLVQPGDYIWFDLNVSGLEDISKNKIKFQVNEDDYDKIDFCTYDSSNILTMSSYFKGDIVSYTSLGVSAEVYKFLIHGVTYLGNKSDEPFGVDKNSYHNIDTFSELKIKKIDKNGNISEITNNKDIEFHLEKGDKLNFYTLSDNSATFDIRIKFKNKYKLNDPSDVILRDATEFVFDKEFLKIDSLELIDASGNGKKANLKTSFSKIRRKNDYSSIDKSDNKYDKFITDNENIIFEVDDHYRGKMKQIKYKKKNDVNEYTYNLTDSSGVSEFNINDIPFFNNIELTKIKFIDDNNDDMELYVRENLSRFKDRIKRDISDSATVDTKKERLTTIIDSSYASDDTIDTTSKTNNKNVRKLLRTFVDDESLFNVNDNIELDADKIFKDTTNVKDFKYIQGKKLRIKKIFNDNSLNHPVRGENTEPLDKNETTNKYFPLTHPGDYIWFDLSENVTDLSSNLLRFSINENNYEKIDIFKPYFNSTTTVDKESIYTYIHPETDGTFNFLIGSVTYVNDPVNNIVVETNVQQIDVFGDTYDFYLNSMKLTTNGPFEYLSLYDHTDSVVGGENIIKYDYIDYELNEGITTFKKDVSNNIVVNGVSGIYTFNNVDISINKHVLKKGVYSMKVPITHPIAIKTKKPKILCLHGGGQTAATFETLMSNIVTSLSNFEFVFASAQSNNNLWYQDPPGGKEVGTDDVTWANDSVKYLDYLVHGEKYYGLIAYSQGVPMSMVYLAKTSNIFEKVILFNGYLPTTHRGLMDVIDMSFSTKTLSVLASNDESFYDLGLDLSSGYFTNFQQVVSSTAGHNIPDLTDPIYQTVIDFMNYTEPFHNDKINISQKYDAITITCEDGASPGNPPDFTLLHAQTTNFGSSYDLNLDIVEFKKNMTYQFNSVLLGVDISFTINQKYKNANEFETYVLNFSIYNNNYYSSAEIYDINTKNNIAQNDPYNNPTINIILGDTLSIKNDNNSHPMKITNNSGTIIFNDLSGSQSQIWKPTQAGTYTYVSTNESTMTGSIIVHENNYDTEYVLSQGNDISLSITIPEKTISFIYNTSNITQRELTVVDDLSKDGYFYYYGDISLTVLDDFHKLDVECKYHGTMGGTNALHYDYLTDFSAITQTTIINSVNNTFTLNNDLITTRNYYLPYNQLTTYDINNYNIFENNTQSRLAFLNADITSVVYSDGENIEEFLDISDGGNFLRNGVIDNSTIIIDTSITDNSFNIDYGDIITFENPNNIDAYITLQSTTDSITTTANIISFTFDDNEANLSYVDFIDANNLTVRGNLIWDFSFIKVNNSNRIDTSTIKYNNVVTYNDFITMNNSNGFLTRIEKIEYKLMNEPSFIEWSSENRNSLNLNLLSNLNVNKLKVIGRNDAEIEMFVYKKYRNSYTTVIDNIRTSTHDLLFNDLRIAITNIDDNDIQKVRSERKNLIREFVVSKKASFEQIQALEFTPNVLYKSIVEDVSDIYIDLQPIPNDNNDLRIGQIFNDNIDDTFNNTISVSGNTIKLEDINNYKQDINNEYHNIYFPLTQPGDYVWLDFNTTGDSSENILKFMINDNDYSKVDLYEFSNNTYVKTQTYNDDERVDLSINNISRTFIISSLVLLGNPFTDNEGPRLESVFVEHTSSNILRLTFNEKLQDTTDRMIATGFSEFTVLLNNSEPLTLSQPTITDNILSFRISEYINFNDISGDIIPSEKLSITYLPGSEHTIKDNRGNTAEQFNSNSININTNIRRPSIVKSIVKNDTPNIIEIEVDEPLNESFVNSEFNRFEIKFRDNGVLSVALISNIVINNNKVFIYLNQNLNYTYDEIFYLYVISDSISIEDTTSIVSIYHDSEIQGTDPDPDLGIVRYDVVNLILDPSDNEPPVPIDSDNNVDNPQILNTIRNAIVIDFDSELKIINKPPIETFIIKNYESNKTYTLSDISVTANRLILTLNTELTHLDTNIRISYDTQRANDEVKRQEDVYKIQDQNENVVESFGLPPIGSNKTIDEMALLVINNIDIPPDIIPPEIIKAEVIHQNKNIINLEFNEDIVVDPSASPVRFRVYITRQEQDISDNVITDINFVNNNNDTITTGSTNKIQLILQDNFKFADIIKLTYNSQVNHTTGNIRDTADNLLPNIPDGSELTVDNRIISSENFVFDLESMSVDVSFVSMLGALFDIESQRLIPQYDPLKNYDATINLTIDVRDVEDVFLFTPDNSYACDPSAWMSWSGRKLDVFGNTMASDGLKSCVDGDNTPYRSRQTGGGEYVRHLSSQITGGYGALDIFGNESELLQAVYDLSSQVHDNIKAVLSDPSCGSKENPVSLDSSIFDGSDNEFVTDDTRKVLSYTFVSQMLISNNSRIQQLVQEHSIQEYNNGVTGSVLSKYGMISVNTVGHMFSVPLRSGDSIQFRVTVKANKEGDNYLSWTELTPYEIEDRSYRVILNLL